MRLLTAGDATAAEAGLAPSFDLARRLVAEALGTALLLAIVVGSGIMGERLAGGSVGLALLANTIATGAGLIVLILVFGPISGAHFNPLVTLVALLQRRITPRPAAAYVGAQAVGAIIGVAVAHLMFELPLLALSQKARDGGGQMLSELVASFALIATVLATSRFRPTSTPAAVGLVITSAYWFTASTSFANPAVAIARSLTNSFAGIAPASLPGFVSAEIAGALLASWLFRWLLDERSSR